MRSLLTRLGHHAVITTNGEEALESWLAAKSAGAPYDLVLMDIQMPQLDGIETTKRIRAREAGAARPPHADPGADREHAGGRSLRLLRGRHGRLPDQAARSREADRGAGGPRRLAASRGLSEASCAALIRAGAAPRFRPRGRRPFSGSASRAAGSAGYCLRDWRGWCAPRSPARSRWLPRPTAAHSDGNRIADR